MNVIDRVSITYFLFYNWPFTINNTHTILSQCLGNLAQRNIADSPQSSAQWTLTKLERFPANLNLATDTLAKYLRSYRWREGSNFFFIRVIVFRKKKSFVVNVISWMKKKILARNLTHDKLNIGDVVGVGGMRKNVRIFYISRVKFIPSTNNRQYYWTR